MNSTLRPLHNRRGQFVIEAILLMVVLLGISMQIARYVKDNQLVSGMVTGPWAKVAGMAEFGVWHAPNAEGQKMHPNNFNRLYTPTQD